MTTLPLNHYNRRATGKIILFFEVLTLFGSRSTLDRAAMATLNRCYENHYYRLWNGVSQGVYFNHASTALPFPDAKKAAETLYRMESEKAIGTQERNHFFEKTRESVATIVQAPSPEECILTLNTTAGISLAAGILGWPAQDMSALYSDNAFVSATSRAFHKEPGNRDSRQDLRTHYISSALPYYYALLHGADRYPDRLEWENPYRREIKHSSHFFRDLNIAYGRIDLKKISGLRWSTRELIRSANLIVLAHVSQNGEAINLYETCGRILKLNPKMRFLIDGAQAVGNVNVDLTSFFKEFPRSVYVFSAHKALNGGVGGVAVYNSQDSLIQEWFTKGGSARHWQPILEGMFSPKGMHPLYRGENDSLSCADWALTSTAINCWEQNGLIRNDFSQISGRRKALRSECLVKLQALETKMKTKIVINDTSTSTDFSLCFKIPEVWDAVLFLLQHDIFVTPLSVPSNVQPRSEWIRVSFQPTNVSEELDRLVNTLEKYLLQKKQNNQSFWRWFGR